jgi:hypothetical protein
MTPQYREAFRQVIKQSVASNLTDEFIDEDDNINVFSLTIPELPTNLANGEGTIKQGSIVKVRYDTRWKSFVDVVDSLLTFKDHLNNFYTASRQWPSAEKRIPI